MAVFILLHLVALHNSAGFLLGPKLTHKENTHHQRCTLRSFEINFKVSIPSLSLSKILTTRSRGSPQEKVRLRGLPWSGSAPSARPLSYSAKSRKNVVFRSCEQKIDPNWFTGFADGEGCFSIHIRKDKRMKLGLEVIPRFTIVCHKRDKIVLQGIKKFLGAGKIYMTGPNAVQFILTSFKNFERVIIHFNKYPLLTNKQADCKLSMLIGEIIRRKEHLTPEGLRKLVAIKAAMNWGLSDKLANAFVDVVPVERPKVELPTTSIHPEWLSGFTSAEGCFYIEITKSTTHLVGYNVRLVYIIGMHARDNNILIHIKEFLNCGHVYQKGEASDYRVRKFDDIDNKIIPFFSKHPIYGVKALDFADWCRAAELMKSKKHLTVDGLEEIRNIKAGMNRGRKLNTLGPLRIFGKTSPHQADATRCNKFFHTHVRSIKRIGPHNKDIISVIIGSLLGDARGNVRTINGTRFFFKQSDKHEKSLLYLYNFFYERGYVIKSGIRSYLVYNNVKGNKKLRILVFNTYTFRSLNWISDIFIKNGKIYLNPKVENYLTPLALTTWIIYRGKFLKELHLNTCFRSIEDIERLANILTNKYGIVCNIYKYNKFYGLSISNTSITAVMDLINLYMTYDLRKIFNEFLIALWLQRNYNNNNNTRIRFIINISHNRFFSTLGRGALCQLCWRGGFYE